MVRQHCSQNELKITNVGMSKIASSIHFKDGSITRIFLSFKAFHQAFWCSKLQGWAKTWPTSVEERSKLCQEDLLLSQLQLQLGGVRCLCKAFANHWYRVLGKLAIQNNFPRCFPALRLLWVGQLHQYAVCSMAWSQAYDGFGWQLTLTWCS